MLRLARALIKNKPFLIVISVLLAVGLLSFGATSIAPSLGPLVKIRGGNISANQFQSYYRNQLLQANLGGLSIDQQKQLQLPQQILQQMVLENILLQIADDMNLQISDSTLAAAIQQTPSFQDPTTGQFSKDRYLGIIRQEGINEGVIIKQVKRNLLLTWLKTYFEAMDFATPALATTWQGVNGRVTFNYLTIDAKNLSDGKAAAKPTDDELQSFYNSNLALYQTPDYRRFQILTLSAQDITKAARKKITVSQGEIKSAYESASEEFTIPPSYQFEQLLFSDKKFADDFARTQKTNQSLATQKSANAKYSKITLNNNDLNGYGFQNDDAIGKISSVVDTPFGFVIVRLVKKTGGGVRPFSSVATTLRARLTAQKTNQAIDDTYRLLNDQLASGKDFAAALKTAGVRGGRITNTGFIDNQGRNQQKIIVKAQPYLDNIKTNGFGDNIKNAPLVLTNNDGGGLVAVALLDNKPPFLPPFASIKNKVANDWQKDKDRNLLLAEKQKIDTKIKNQQFDFTAYQKAKKIPISQFAFSQSKLLSTEPLFKNINNDETLRLLFAPAATAIPNNGTTNSTKLFVMKLLPRPATSNKNNAGFKQQRQAATAEGALLHLYRIHDVSIDWERLDSLFGQ